MSKRDWDIVTSYIDKVGTSDKVVSFNKVQDSVRVKNQGNVNLIYTIGTKSGTLAPNASITVNENLSSFTVKAASGVCSFEVRASEAGTEQEESTPILPDDVAGKLEELSASVAQKANQTEVNATNLRVDALVINSGDANAEVTDSHVSTVKNKTFTTVRNRLEETESDVYTSIKNLVINGDFRNGVTGWNATSTSTISATNNTLSIIGSGTSLGVLRTYQQAMTVSPSDKVFCKMRVRVTNANATSLQVKLRGSVSGTVDFILNQASPVANQWYDAIALLTLPANFSGSVQFEISHTYADAATALNKVLEVQYMLLTDLTKDYGALNEPSYDDMVELLSYFTNGWFDISAPVGPISKRLVKEILSLKKNQNNTLTNKKDKIFLAKYDANTYYVYYKPNGSKWIRHEFYRYVYAPQYADVWVTQEITTGYSADGKYPDESGFVFTVDTPITNRGSSHEFSYFILGDDYRGTRHGCETFDYFRIYCDGIPTTLTNGQCKAHDRISLIEESHLVSITDGTTVQAKIFKEWNFDQRGLDYRLITNFITNLTITEGLTWQMPVMTYDASTRPKACKYYSHLSGDDKTYDLSIGDISTPKQSHGFIMWNDITGVSFKSFFKDDWRGQLNNFADLEDGNSVRPTSGTGFRKTYFTRHFSTAGKTVNAGDKWEIRTRTEVFLKE
jgi:hypothetical protein